MDAIRVYARWARSPRRVSRYIGHLSGQRSNTGAIPLADGWDGYGSRSSVEQHGRADSSSRFEDEMVQLESCTACLLPSGVVTKFVPRIMLDLARGTIDVTPE